MRIHVVCGAGASSTFVAQRLRRAAEMQGRTVDVTAGTPASVTTALQAGDLVLIGPHLADDADGLRADIAARGGHAVLLPPDIFGDRDGTRTLSLADDAVARSTGSTGRTPR